MGFSSPYCSFNIKFWTYGATPIYVNGVLDEGVFQFQIALMDAILEMIYRTNGKTVSKVWARLGEWMEAAITVLIQSPEPKWPTPDAPTLSPPQRRAALPPSEDAADGPEDLVLYIDIEDDLEDVIPPCALQSHGGRPHSGDGEFMLVSTPTSPLAVHRTPPAVTSSALHPTPPALAPSPALVPSPTCYRLYPVKYS